MKTIKTIKHWAAFVVLCGFGGFLIGCLLAAVANRTPLLNAFLQTDIDGNGKSATNFNALQSLSVAASNATFGSLLASNASEFRGNSSWTSNGSIRVSILTNGNVLVRGQMQIASPAGGFSVSQNPILYGLLRDNGSGIGTVQWSTNLNGLGVMDLNASNSVNVGGNFTVNVGGAGGSIQSTAGGGGNVIIGTGDNIVLGGGPTVPGSDDTYTFGTTAARWAAGYFGTVHGSSGGSFGDLVASNSFKLLTNPAFSVSIIIHSAIEFSNSSEGVT